MRFQEIEISIFIIDFKIFMPEGEAKETKKSEMTKKRMESPNSWEEIMSNILSLT